MIVNEVQTNEGYVQGIEENALRALIDIGALVHVQTTVVTSGYITPSR